jgi:SHS2 domain-containing protein
MPYRMIEHTADLCFEVTAGSYGELLAEALRAMTEWTGPSWGSGSAERHITVVSPDRTMLMVDLLNEALTLSQIHHEAYDRFEPDVLEEHLVSGRLMGFPVVALRDEIKAVTYHGADVGRLSDGSWTATILMDI